MEQRTIQSAICICSYEELCEADKRLVDVAVEQTSRSYSPYSHFSVGAALRLADGTVYRGCNQENAAFGVTMCAERSALFAAGAAQPQVAAEAIAIAARGTDKELVDEPVSPCGICRQAMIETEQRGGVPLHIILCGREKFYVMEGIRTLMPLSFSEF